jgi:DNA-binding NtrC family response regulator
MLAASTLLVEDEPDVAQSYIARFDEQAGLKLDWAETWEKGLAMFRVAGHPLVIADYNLPDSQHGLQLLVMMKRLVPHSRLILISGAMSPQAENLAKTIDFLHGFYPKRVGVGDLLLHEAQQVADHSEDPSNWPGFATGYLTDPRSYQDELDQIDKALTTDVARRA